MSLRSLITTSYANVDFLKIPEPYNLLKANKNPEPKSGTMISMDDLKPSLLLDTQVKSTFYKSGVLTNKVIPNSKKKLFSAQTSQAHMDALNCAEKHNLEMQELKMQKVVREAEMKNGESKNLIE